MKVHWGIEELKPLRKAVVTTGFFDGVHKGHRKILGSVAEEAQRTGGESMVLTFWPHPRVILHPEEKEMKIITTLNEKSDLIATCGIDHLMIIPFTKEFSLLSSEEFIRKIIVDKIGTKKLIIGYDHRFGKNREGSFEYLKQHCSEFGFEVLEIPREDVDNMGVSSTLIRNALLEGNVSAVSNFLGRYYSIAGTVIQGKELGKKLGFPTANIQPEEPSKIIPMDGIYAVKTEIKGKLYKGMLSIGYNPTVSGKEKTIEVHIFDFNEDIYGENIKIFFVEYLRPEEKFNSLEELIEQLKKDQESSLKILNSKSLLSG
jgi:riboflavin kinase/FMN adenylyltransferase